jgi:DNA repair protein RadC
MSKNIYCIGKMKGNQMVMEVAVKNNELFSEKTVPAKRVDIVSIKMVKESSLLYKDRKVSSPNDAYKLIKEFLECADREELIVCSLDTKNQPTTINVVSIGTLNSSLVHPREVFKVAILSNAASIIIAHNHPSGHPEPSTEDINITNRLKECGKLLGIDVIDHIIIGTERFVSLKEKGIL